jgi:glyoxylase-like metal-dependent hydrolase (beta-lactamase superfamily II)
VTADLPVANAWWALDDVGAGVTRLIERHIDVMLESNVWHVRGRDRDLVVDTANGIGALRPVIDGLAEGRPVLAVVTHGHFDHVGGLHEFDDRRGHAADADEVREPYPMRMRRSDFPDDAAEMYAYYGYPVPETIVDAVPDGAFDVAAWSSPGAELTATVAEGDMLDLGDRRLEVLHVPGHTPGSIAIWEHETGTLFTGDMLYVDARLSYDDAPTAAGSLRLLRALPVRRVLAGHDRAFSGDEFTRVADETIRRLVTGDPPI